MPMNTIRGVWLAAALVPGTLHSMPPPQQQLLHSANAFRDPVRDVVRDKNFYALSLFLQDSVLRRELANDPALRSLQAERTRGLRDAQTTCEGQAPCALAPLVWSDGEMEAAAAALRAQYRASAAMRSAVAQLRRSGAYRLYADEDGPALLSSAWRVCAEGLNHDIRVYGQGAKPLYPEIDSPSYDVGSATFGELASLVVGDALAKPYGAPDLFFSSSMEAALRLLRMNGRDEAARFESLRETVNRAALHSLRSVDWNRYTYSMLLVPGAGPEDAVTSLASGGRARVALVAEAFRRGAAPFVLVSGGFVHPAQTRFAEAAEMKAALIRDFGVPESAILLDPYARHTTTNLRNAVRAVFTDGLPFEKPMLIVSDPEQIRYIASEKFAMRCRAELGYLPAETLRQVSETELAVRPGIDSLEENPLDPLDP